MKLDLGAILASLPVNVKKDARRIALFQSAVASKTLELATEGNFNNALVFVSEAAILIQRWVDRSLKFQFPKDFLTDPYKTLREDTRKFGRQWQLDPVFMEEMG